MDKVTRILWIIPLLVVSVSSLKPPLGSNITDIHKGFHCWDVSIWEPPEYNMTMKEKCHTEFEKVTVNKTKKDECVTWHSVNCTIVDYVECKMTPVVTKYNITMMIEKNFTEIICKDENVTHWHVKQIPHCEPVTKQQCITNWVLVANGSKIWTDNEQCKNVTWNECVLKPKHVQYNTTHPNCTMTKNETYWDCVKMENETTTYNMTCTPKAALNCTPVEHEDCTTVEWQESYYIANETCTDKKVKVPYQNRKHRKQCILPSADDKLDPGLLDNLKLGEIVPDNQLQLKGKRKRRNARKSFYDQRMKKSSENYGSKYSSHAPEG